jgi:repressor LexA
MKAKLTQRQAEVLNFLTRFVSRTGYPPTLREIARHFGIKGISAIKKHLDTLEKKGYLARGNGARAIEMADLPQSVSVPVLGQVAAGRPILAEENLLGTLALDRSMVRGGQVFLLKVKGESMIGAGILEGDLVLVKAQSRAENGEIVVALVESASGGEATIKRLDHRGHHVVLKPENPDHSPITLTQSDHFRIIGKVVGVVRVPVF